MALSRLRVYVVQFFGIDSDMEIYTSLEKAKEDAMRQIVDLRSMETEDTTIEETRHLQKQTVRLRRWKGNRSLQLTWDPDDASAGVLLQRKDIELSRKDLEEIL